MRKIIYSNIISLAKLNNSLNEKEKLIKIIKEDLEITENKYQDSIMEKEKIKSLLNIKSCRNELSNTKLNVDLKNETISDHTDAAFNIINHETKDSKITFNQININNTNNNNFNILSNFKNGANEINSRNKLKQRPDFNSRHKLNDSDENKMNMTIDINNKPSNFALFNNNLTSRNSKVRMNR